MTFSCHFQSEEILTRRIEFFFGNVRKKPAKTKKPKEKIGEKKGNKLN